MSREWLVDVKAKCSRGGRVTFQFFAELDEHRPAVRQVAEMVLKRGEAYRLDRTRDKGILVWMQLRDQLAAAIASGALSPGERLPTLREMALDARVDMNTVKRVYDDLQEHGLVVIHHGRGAFVTDKQPQPTDNNAQASALTGLATHAVDMAERLGFSAADLAKAILELQAKDTST